MNEDQVEALLMALSSRSSDSAAPGDHPGEPEIWGFAGGELSEEDTARVLGHVLRCAECRQTYDDASRFIERMEKEEPHPGADARAIFERARRLVDEPPREGGRQSPRLLRLAPFAAALAAVLLLLVLGPWWGVSAAWPDVSFEAQRAGEVRGPDDQTIPEYALRMVLKAPGEASLMLNAYVFLARFAGEALVVERLFPIRAGDWDPEVFAGWPQNPIQLAPGVDLSIPPVGDEWRFASPRVIYLLTGFRGTRDGLSDEEIEVIRAELRSRLASSSPAELESLTADDLGNLGLEAVRWERIEEE